MNVPTDNVNQTFRVRRRALVVDDEYTIRPVLCGMFELLGFDAVEAASADEALAKLESDPAFDALLTDVQMPGSMNGVTLATLVKQRYPSMLIVVMTGFDGNALSELPQGIPVLWKPFRLNDIRRLVDALNLIG